MITQPHKLFNRVVDSLDLRINSSLPPSPAFVSKLPVWQRFIADCAEGGFDVQPHREFIPGAGPFTLLAYGKKPYKYVLSNPSICDIRIWNPSKWSGANKGKTGQLYVNFRSQFLQYKGIDGVREVLDAICEFFYGLEYFELDDEHQFVRVSRIDLAADVSHPGFEWTDLDTFVSKARYRDTIASNRLMDSALGVISSLEPVPGISPLSDNKGGATYTQPKFVLTEYQMGVLKQALSSSSESSAELGRVIHDRTPQTIYFGKFGGALYARLYNKSASLDKQQKGYMRDIWAANGWDQEIDVWRTEFSMSGDFLKKAGDALLSGRDDLTGEVLPDLRDFDLVVQALDSLWTYCTMDWLRQIDGNADDSNKWRGDNTQFWDTVSSAFDNCQTLFRSRPARNPDDEQLAAQLKGVATSLLALRMTDSEDLEPQYGLLSTVAEWFESDSYLDELRDRRIELGIDDYTSDTLYSASVRKECLALGLGS